MGRTLHYQIHKEGNKNFTEKELQAMEQISHKYNSGKFKKVWTCENFYCDPLAYYPNWYSSSKIKELRNESSDKVWNFIVDTIKAETEANGGNKMKAVLKAYKEGYIMLHRENWRNEVREFVKTQGNELNSLLVYLALLEMSVMCPNLIITLSDEGEFLLCDLTIMNGKVLPNLESISNDIDRWTRELAVKELNLAERYPEEFKLLGEQGIDNAGMSGFYSDHADKYLKEALKKYARAMLIIKEHIKEPETRGMGFQLNVYNIEHLDPKNWFEPTLFCRAVNVEDFYSYESGASKLMDGFEGEYWGLTTEDAEAKSYRMIAQMQKLFGKKNMKILPNLKEPVAVEASVLGEESKQLVEHTEQPVAEAEPKEDKPDLS